MKCLKDFIGINYCGNTIIPDSKTYINSLPGVELQNIDKIANAEQIDFIGVWNEIQERGLNRFKTDIISEFGKRYRLRQIQQSVNLGKKINTSFITPASTQWRGFTIEFNYETDTLVKSTMQHIYIQELNLYLSTAINTTLKIFDLDLGEELYTHSLTGIQGWNRIKLFQGFDARRIFVCYDATLIDSVKFDIDNFYLDNFSFYDNYYYSFWNNIQTTSRMMGAHSTGLPITVTQVKQAHDTFGLSAIWSVKCSYNSIICANKEYFTQALLYCLGSELMTERINSPRINRWTTIDKPKAQELRKFFEVRYKGGMYDETEYTGELINAIYGINLNQYDSCLECDNAIIFRDSMP